MVEKHDSNGGKYVSYKALLFGLGSTVGTILVILGLYWTFAPAKVNKELYDRDYYNLCNDISGIRNTVNDNGAMVNRINRNQELVLRALNIEPVK